MTGSTVKPTGKKPINTSEKDPSKVVGEGSLSTGGTRAARAARAKKEQNSNSNSDSKSLNNTINGVKEAINDIKGNSSKQRKQTKTENENNSSPDNSAKTVSKEDYDKLTEKYNALTKELDNYKQENNTYYIFNRDLQQRLFESQDAHDAVLKQYNDLNKLFEEYKSKQSQETTKNASEPNVEESQVDTTAQTEEPKATSSEKAEEVKTDNSEEDLSSSRDVDAEWLEIAKALNEGRLSDAQKLADQTAKKYGYTSEPKATNSGTTEETVAPEAGKAKVEGEPQAKTEQAQATQESAKEANARPGTGEVTKDNIISPEDAFKFFNNKENYDKASTVFKTPSFDEYIDATTGKWIPRSYFDAFNAKDGIDPKKFTFEHFKAKIPEDPGKQLTAEEKTADLYNKNKAEEDYAKEYKKFNTGFKAYLRRHPKLEKILKTGKMVGGVSILYGLGQMFNDAYTAGQNDKDEVQNIIDRLNDDDPEPLVGNVNNNNTNPGNIAEQLKNADKSTEPSEDNSGTIEQAIAEQTPAGNVEPKNPQVAANAATSTNTKANNAPASTAKSAPTQDTAQGLPPVVTRNTPSTNPDSRGMTYSQRVEAGQSPKAGSMAYNANNPDMVTAGLIDAMNQNPQAGSDAIGYGDLYDQNFIDFWAKRNPNLAFGVSQGRR